MTDKKDDYYQPWLRNPAPDTAATGRAAASEEPLAKPKEAPPLGVDLDRYPLRAEPARRPSAKTERIGTRAAQLWAASRRGGAAFANWTIALGARADIPAKVEAMEIPRRSRVIAQKGSAAAAASARAVVAAGAKAGRVAADAAGSGWTKMALGDKVARLSGEARAGIGQVARSGKHSIGEAASKLRPTAPPKEAPPPSGLDQLLAREQQEIDALPAAARPSAPDLPLFAGEPGIEMAPAKVAKIKTAAATPPPSVSAPAPDDRMSLGAPQRARAAAIALPYPIWTMAAGAIALLAVTFWLGTRFGGGMSKSDVETIVADYIDANPQIIPAALEAQRDREIAKAIDAIRPALEKPYAGAWAGNADGDVTMVVFTDYACGFCRASLPDVDRLIREDKRLKVVFRELPIIAPQSRDAALMALTAARQGKYDAFHHAMFAASSLDPSAIAAAAAKAGVVTDGSADATANEALFQREIDNNLAIASQLQLNATPTWVIGDQLFQGQIGYDALRGAVAKARADG